MRTLLMVAMTFVLGAAAAAEAGKKFIPNSITDVKRGEWVLMEDVSAGGAGEHIKVTATAVTDSAVTLRRERFGPDGVTIIDTTENEIPRSRMGGRFADLQAKAKEITDEFVMIGEQRFPVTAVYWEGDEKDAEGKPHEYKVWLSEQLPLAGVAKFWSSDAGIPHAEILDYGFGE